MDNIETHYNNMSATMKSLEVQVGQLATKLKNQQKGNFPNDTEQNSRDYCKAITLRCGKEVESSGQKEKRGREAIVTNEVKKELEEVRPAEAVTTCCSESPIHCSEGPKFRGISFPDNPLIISHLCPSHKDFRRKSSIVSSPSSLIFSRRFTSIYLLLMPQNRCPTMQNS